MSIEKADHSFAVADGQVNQKICLLSDECEQEMRLGSRLKYKFFLKIFLLC